MPIAIVGMHRSGTSMLTRMLHLAGLELGPVDKLMGPAFDNPDGFWENLEFVHINELLLHQFGGSWSSPPTWPPGWTTDPRLDEIRRAAVRLPGNMQLREPWGWKDPRTTVTLEFWRSLWPDLRVVVCVRNPLEVACSLSQRDGLSLRTGLCLWLQYYEQLFRSIGITSCAVCHYEAILNEPDGHLRRVLAFCGLPGDDKETIARACAARHSALRHHGLDRAALEAMKLPPGLLGLYDQLADHGQFPRPRSTTPRLVASAVAVREALEWELQANEAQHRLNELSRRHAELEQRFAALLQYARDRAYWVEAMRERFVARRYRYADHLVRWVRRVVMPWRAAPRELHHLPPPDPGFPKCWERESSPDAVASERR